MKRFVSGVLTFALICFPLFSTGVVAEHEAFDWEAYIDWTDDEIPTTFVNGVAAVDQDVIEEHRASLLDRNGVSACSLEDPYPSRVILSENEAFPPIRSQGNIGSCGAFAAVYYQYTYEVNAINGTSAAEPSNQYSPNWPYYASLRDDSDCGLGFDDIYEFLMDHGALKWEEDVYDQFTFQTSMPWPTDKEAMRTALSTRLYNWNIFEIESAGASITSNQDVDLDEAKAVLNFGKLLKVSMAWSGDASNFLTNRNDLDKEETIFYRCGEASTRHALVIVGYDDNVTYDINGDGVIEDGEKGAFKIANSYGEGWGDKGFFWLMYDALNEVSSVSGGDWDDPSTRVPAFENMSDPLFETGDNLFSYIYAENKEPMFFAEIDLLPHNLDNFNIRLHNQYNGYYDTDSYEVNYGNKDYVTTSNRTLIYDYEEALITADVEADLYWGVYIGNNGQNPEGIVSSIKLTDNLGNVIMNFPSERNDWDIFSCTTQLNCGDVNYDGVLNNTDAETIMNYIAKNIELSYVQLILADYNGDGKINLRDASALSTTIS